MNIFGRKPAPVQTRGDGSPTISAGDFAGRVEAMNSHAASASSTEDAIIVMREATGITNDLMKSISAIKQGEAPNAQEEPDATVADATDAVAANDVDNAVATDPVTDPATAAPEGVTPDAGDVAGVTDPDDADEGQPLAKSIEEILDQAQKAAQSQGAELQVDGSNLIGPLLKAVVHNQEQSQVTNDYLEQLGSLLTKSLEGIAAIAENQQALHENQQNLSSRLADIETVQQQSVLAAGSQTEQFQKSVEAAVSTTLAPVMGFINNIRQSPQGTPQGRAPLAPGSVAGVTLADAAPIVAVVAESHLGFTRDELKKGIEAHIRSDRAKETGITTQHYLACGQTPLADLDPQIYEVASRELKRPLPTS
ncbi:MAG TPA: hypothetical protein VGB77_15720 [Abditibacteriaceae bacterium]